MINFSDKPMTEAHKMIRKGAVMGQIKAMWEAGVVPQIVVYQAGVFGVPQQFWNGEYLKLNIGTKQIGAFHEGKEHMEFSTRFNGKDTRVNIPYESIAIISDRDGLFVNQMQCFIYDPVMYREAVEHSMRNSIDLASLSERDVENLPQHIKDQIVEINKGAILDTSPENASTVLDPKQINLRHKTETNGGRPSLSLV